MLLRIRRHAPWVTGWLLASTVGALLLGQSQLTQLRARFDADTDSAYQLINQRAAQLEAALTTLVSLRASSGLVQPEQLLVQIYPQIVGVQRRDGDGAWNDKTLEPAEAESLRLRHAVITAVNLEKGRYQLVMAGRPSSYAILVDLRTLVPWSQWPMSPEASPVRVTLEHGGQTFVLQPGQVVPQDPAGWQLAYRRTLGTAAQPFELVARHQVRWADLPWSPIAIWSLVVAVVLVTTRALMRRRTDRVRAQELLRLGETARRQTLGALANGVAQELEQPLNRVLTHTLEAQSMLALDPPDLDQTRLELDQAADQAREATGVVDRLRHAVDLPDLGDQMRDLELRPFARQALHLLEPELRRRGIRARIEQPGTHFRVRARPLALEQILHHLLINALHALDQVPRDERTLVITLGVVDACGQLSLRDSGPGIASKDLPHLFKPFFSTRAGGLGLGLNLCESLASSMGGNLLAFNCTPRGAEFCLRLPLSTFP